MTDCVSNKEFVMDRSRSRPIYSQYLLPLKEKHFPPPPPLAGAARCRGAGSCVAVRGFDTGSGRFSQAPLEFRKLPLPQLIWTQRPPSSFWPLAQISGQTRSVLLRTTSSASRLATLTSNWVLAFLLNSSSALRELSSQVPSTLPALQPTRFK